MRLYSELANWFHLLTHPSDYDEEAATYTRLILEAVPAARTVLELGSGGGNNASHMKQHFALTLSDMSPDMLALSATINPECEHIPGDMRTLGLDRTFDAVFAHDAVEYMTTRQDLRAAVQTAFVHTRPGGVALFVPDATRESFAPMTDHGGHDGADGRGLRYVEWTTDANPDDDQYDMDFACLLREPDGTVHVEYDHQLCACYPRAVWIDLLEGAGFSVTTPELDPEVHEGQVVFVCRKPG